MSRSRLIGVLALALVSCGGILALGGAPAETSAGATIARCAPPHLKALYVNSTGALGTVTREYAFKNLALASCTMSGYPKVQMLKSTGAPLSTTVQHLAAGQLGIRQKTLVLSYGSLAYFALSYASATGYGRLSCPLSAGLRLVAPGQAGGIVLKGKAGRIRPFGGTTAHLHCGIVRVSALTTRRFQ